MKYSQSWLWMMFLTIGIFSGWRTYGQESGPTIVRDIAYSPDGLYLAYTLETPECYSDNPPPFLVRIVDANTGEVIQTVGKDEDCPYNAVAWSPDSTRIALSSQAGTASIWDVNAGTQVTLYSNSGYGVRSLYSVAWHPMNDRLVIGDAAPYIWDAQTGSFVGSPLMEVGSPNFSESIVWSPDGNNIALATRSNGIEIWDVSTTTTPEQWSLVRRIDAGPITKIDYSPSGQLIAAVNTTEVHVFDVTTGLHTEALVGATNTITDIVWSPDGLYITAGDFDGILHIWEYATQIEIATYNSLAPIYAVDWHPDDQQIAFGGRITPNGEYIMIEELFSQDYRQSTPELEGNAE